MIFEIFDEKGKRVFFTYDINCVPNKTQLNSMIKGGYKLKLNEKFITKKKLEEIISGDKENNKSGEIRK